MSPARLSPRWLSLAAAAALCVAALNAPSPSPGPAAADGPKTVILGFDGMDHGLTSDYMARGLLPNFQRLAEQGRFQPLDTSNPAQSPVSWAVVNTGTNPGKTGVAGFVSRHLTDFGPAPHPMLGDPVRVDAREHVRFPMALDNRLAFVGGTGLGVALVIFLLLKLVGLPAPLVLLLALGGGAGAGFMAKNYADSLPADGKVPYMVNPMQGTNFWSHLDAQGVRLRGIQLASTYPPDREGPHTELLPGLGLPDVGGSNGTFYVYTNDPWTWEKNTSNGGKIVKVYEDTPGKVAGDLYGPRNWVQKAKFEARIDVLQTERDNPKLSAAETQAIDDELAELKAEMGRWSEKDEVTRVPFSMDIDLDAKRVTFTTAGVSVTVEEGGWSDYIPVTFELGPRFASHALARFHLMECTSDDVRVFVPPLCIDPEMPPEWLPITSPPEFSKQLAEAIGQRFETLGWGCMANPLKDFESTEFSVQSFVDDLAENISWRRKILTHSLGSADDWDVYFQVYGDTDRMAHMLYREMDPEHPAHDPEQAASLLTMFGETFPQSEAVIKIYQEADRIVGEVLDAMQAGTLGPDPLLMVISDHGFTSWRWSVNLNNALADAGFLALKDGMTAQQWIDAEKPKEFLGHYIDWSGTRAYSMGLGKVFINLKGREKDGIVEPEDYEATVEAVRAMLLDLRDPATGEKFVTSADRRDVLFKGPWWKEGKAERLEAGKLVPFDNGGFADIFLGYAPYYRVAGSNTMGGLGEAVVTVNTGHWSGGHVSVDPSHVRGILFTSLPLDGEQSSSLLEVAPTVLQRHGVDPTGLDLDGHALHFGAH